MIHVWWALFAPFAGYSDVEVWMVHSTMPAILSLLGRLPCLSLFKLPLRIALENILAECQCAPCPKVQAKISGGYIYSVVNPECCADCSIARGTAQKGLVLEKNALNRLVHNLLELISKGYNPTDLSQQPSCNFPGKQLKILFHNLYVD